MGDLLTVIGAVVAVLASMGAVVVVVEQFTLRARLRKIEAWALAASVHDADSPRAEALASVRLDATARILAGTLLPARFFVEGVLWGVGAPALVLVSLVGADVTWGSVAAFTGLAFTASMLSIRRAIRLYLERCRVASEYRRGLPVVEPRHALLDQMEGGRRVEFLFAIAYSAGVVLLAFGIGLAVSGSQVGGLSLFLMVGGGGGAWAALDMVRGYARRHHPMR